MTNVPLAMNGLSVEEIELVCEVFRSGNNTLGEKVLNFEKEFASKLGAKYAVMVNSGSSANLLAVQAWKENELQGDQSRLSDMYIAVPAVLWPTTIWPIVQSGFKALVIDTLPNSLEMDLEILRKAKIELGDKLVAAFIIHPLGKSLDLTELEELQNNLHLTIFEDNCESLGAGQDVRFAGTVGTFGTYSFYFSHHITTVEGGMITTNNEKFANTLLSMRAHGWVRNRLDRENLTASYPELSPDFLFITSGYNFRPMEFQGILGSSQLKQLDCFIERRIANASKIGSSLAGSSLELLGWTGVELGHNSNLPVPHSWMALPIRSSIGAAHSKHVQDRLALSGIATRPLLAGDFMAQPAGRHSEIEAYGTLTNSRKLYSESFMIGNHHNFSSEQVLHLETELKMVSQ